MRMTRKTSAPVATMCGLLMIAFAACGVPSVGAEELKLRITSYIVDHGIKPVGDVEGHIAGPYLRRGLVFTGTGEVGTYRSTGTIDMVKGKGHATGESSFSFGDGSTIAVDFNAAIASRPGGGLLYEGFTGGFVVGTGRFAGIAGKLLSATGVALTPFGEETRSDAYFDLVFDYSVPRK